LASGRRHVWANRVIDLRRFQIKQDHEIALSGTYQARSDTAVESTIAAINSPAFLNAAAKLYANRAEDLTMQEAVAWEFYVGSNMTMFENNHQQYLLGYLSEEHWQKNVREITCMLEQPVTRQMVTGWAFQRLFRKTDQRASRARIAQFYRVLGGHRVAVSGGLMKVRYGSSADRGSRRMSAFSDSGHSDCHKAIISGGG